MKRRQLFEFHEKSWFPEVIREGHVEVLSLADRSSGFATALAPGFAEVLAQTRCRTVLDLCSGAGSPVAVLLETLAAADQPLPRLKLTDLYPPIPAWTKLRKKLPEHVDFVTQPVDATCIPGGLEGDLVTVVNALHHFPKPLVRTLFEQVVKRGSALYVAEAFPRSFVRASAFLLPLGLACWRNPLVCERNGWAKAALSWPFPVLSVTGLWDWMVSVVRMYEPADLLGIARDIAPHYYWQHGSASYGGWGEATYFWGAPVSATASSS